MIKTLSLVLGLVTATSLISREPPARALASQERTALAALESTTLAHQSAGAAGDVQVLDGASRAALERLQGTEQLEDMRAGDLEVSNNDLSTVLLVLGILVLVGILI